MTDTNKHNLLFFESPTMKGLFEDMQKWQQENNKRLLSTNVQLDGDAFCCIALSNPTEVIICSGSYGSQAAVDRGALVVRHYP